MKSRYWKQTEDYGDMDGEEGKVDLVEGRLEPRMLGCHGFCVLSELFLFAVC